MSPVDQPSPSVLAPKGSERGPLHQFLLTESSHISAAPKTQAYHELDFLGSFFRLSGATSRFLCGNACRFIMLADSSGPYDVVLIA